MNLNDDFMFFLGLTVGILMVLFLQFVQRNDNTK